MQDSTQHGGQVGGTVGGQLEQVIPQPQEIFLSIGLPGVCWQVLHQLLLLLVPLLCCAFNTCNITGQQVGLGLDFKKKINLQLTAELIYSGSVKNKHLSCSAASALSWKKRKKHEYFVLHKKHKVHTPFGSLLYLKMLSQPNQHFFSFPLLPTLPFCPDSFCGCSQSLFTTNNWGETGKLRGTGFIWYGQVLSCPFTRDISVSITGFLKD